MGVMTQIIDNSKTIKIGTLRHPETKERFFPFTHWSGVFGLDAHVIDLVGGKLNTAVVPINGTNRTVYAPTTFSDTGFFAPTDEGTQYDLLISNGTGAPSWQTFGNGFLTRTANGWTVDGNTYLLAEDGVVDTKFMLAATSSDVTAISGDQVDPYANLVQTKNGSAAVNGSVRFKGIGPISVKGTAAGEIEISSDALSQVHKYYVKNNGVNITSFDPASADKYTELSMRYSDGSVITPTATVSAGFMVSDGTTTRYQKISAAALVNDTVDTLILDGNFS